MWCGCRCGRGCGCGCGCGSLDVGVGAIVVVGMGNGWLTVRVGGGGDLASLRRRPTGHTLHTRHFDKPQLASLLESYAGGLTLLGQTQRCATIYALSTCQQPFLSRAPPQRKLPAPTGATPSACAAEKMNEQVARWTILRAKSRARGARLQDRPAIQPEQQCSTLLPHHTPSQLENMQRLPNTHRCQIFCTRRAAARKR